MKRYGDWILTHQGVKFYPMDPLAYEVEIGDIAHALSMLCRFGGHCKEFYSVAQHCAVGAEWMLAHGYSKKEALEFLLHDASEAYLCDLVRPLKRGYGIFGRLFGWLYRHFEKKVDRVIRVAFQLPKRESVFIKLIDRRMLLTEKRDLMRDPPRAWKLSENGEAFDFTIHPWAQQYAKRIYMDTFYKLTGNEPCDQAGESQKGQASNWIQQHS